MTIYNPSLVLCSAIIVLAPVEELLVPYEEFVPEVYLKSFSAVLLYASAVVPVFGEKNVTS